MDHLHLNNHHQSTQSHHHPLHWNYSSGTSLPVAPITSTPTPVSSNVGNNTWTPPSRKALKRAMSESDCDDIYSEESSKEHASSVENDSCQLLTRKKRRGVIEKKRRDRINNSLCELKRLVPSAFEKQGSAKLEKAEILQLTVDHLKTLQNKGIDSLGFDPQRFAMDYHIIGFRECASEVARYLVTIEGMDIQDPLRLRLMSHLQCFVAQRELSAKSSPASHSHSASSGHWSSFQNTYQPNYQNFQSYPTTPVTPHQQSQHSFSSSYLPSATYLSSQNNSSALTTSVDYSSGYGSSISQPSSANHSLNNNTSTSASPTPTSTSGQTNVTTSNNSQDNQPVYIELSNSNDQRLLGGSGYHHYSGNTGNNGQLYGESETNNFNNNNSKPYRPWHPEMAY